MGKGDEYKQGTEDNSGLEDSLLAAAADMETFGGGSKRATQAGRAVLCQNRACERNADDDNYDVKPDHI